MLLNNASVPDPSRLAGANFYTAFCVNNQELKLTEVKKDGK